MQTDDIQKKAAPTRASKKSEGWREREEASAAGVAPRKADARDTFALVVSA